MKGNSCSNDFIIQNVVKGQSEEADSTVMLLGLGCTASCLDAILEGVSASSRGNKTQRSVGQRLICIRQLEVPAGDVLIKRFLLAGSEPS